MKIVTTLCAGLMLAALAVACMALMAIHHIGRRAAERRA